MKTIIVSWHCSMSNCYVCLHARGAHAIPLQLPLDDGMFQFAARDEMASRNITPAAERTYVVEMLAVIDYRIFLRYAEMLEF